MRSFFNKEKDREFKPSNKIVLASGTSGSGISFVSQLMAMELTKLSSVSVTELGKPYFYSALGMEKRFYNRGFVNYFDMLRANEHIDFSKKNEFLGVNWYVKLANDSESLPISAVFRAIHMPKEEYCLFDCSGLSNELSLSLLAEADLPIIVIDPLPSKLILARDFLESARISLPEAVLVVNQMNNGVHRAELSRFLGTKDYFSIPSVPQEYIYKAEYNSIPVSELPEIGPSMAKTQDMLSKLFQ